MQVADVMTKPAISVGPDDTLAAAARLMLQHRISGLPVVDKAGALIGILTEGDLLRRAETGTERRHRRWVEFLISPGRLAEDYAHAHARKVGEIMTHDVLTASPQDALEQVVSLMERHRIKRVPVLEGGGLVGIVSRANLVRAFLRQLPRHTAAVPAGCDTALREDIIDEIARQPWGPRASVDVQVAAGIVDLYGSITDERERDALLVLVENMPGVKEVRDNLVWVEPVSGFVIPPIGSAPTIG